MDFIGLSDSGTEQYKADAEEIIRGQIGLIATCGAEDSGAILDSALLRTNNLLSKQEAKLIVAGNAAMVGLLPKEQRDFMPALNSYSSGLQALAEGTEVARQALEAE